MVIRVDRMRRFDSIEMDDATTSQEEGEGEGEKKPIEMVEAEQAVWCYRVGHSGMMMIFTVNSQSD